MKKLLALCLALLCLVSAAASAEVLADGWQDAGLEALQQAQQDIANRISELRAASAPAADRVELSGSGTSILTDVAIDFSPARVIIECEGETSVAFTGGDYDYTFSASSYEQEFFDQTGAFDLLIESTGPWAVTVEPIADGGALPMEGSGPFVSNFFELPAPMIVTVASDAGEMDALLSNLIVSLCHQYENIESWRQESLTNELLSGGDTFSADVILQPVDGRTQYCLSVECEPGVSWSITPKG